MPVKAFKMRFGVRYFKIGEQGFYEGGENAANCILLSGILSSLWRVITGGSKAHI